MTRPKNSESTAKEARIQRAIRAMKKNSKLKLRKAARDFKVPRSTLQNRVNGKKPRNMAHENCMHLTHIEESELVRWITQLTERGYAPRYQTVQELAEIIRNRRVFGVNDETSELVRYEPFGRDWVPRFLARYPQLQSARRKCIEAARIKDVSEARLTKWFHDLRAVVNEHEIEPHNIYNMDESGFAIGDVEASQRIINAEIRQRFQAKPGRQAWVTAVECICADGSFIPPLIIFKGKKLSRQWISTNTPKDWRFGCNTKGWTSNEHGIQWLRGCFEPETREKADGKMRLLICDGHDSHITGAWIAHCMNNNIVLMVLPPHSSHLTQPLDVGVFGPLKRLMASALESHLSTQLHRMINAEWLFPFVQAHEGAFSVQNIRGGFCGTGIFPYNPSKVLNRIKSPVQDCIEIRPSTPTTSVTPFVESVLTSSPINTEEARIANAALMSQISQGGILNSPARQYAKCLIRRSERLQAQNIIIETQHNKLQTAVCKRSRILSGKRKVIDGHHILTTSEMLTDITQSEKITKSRRKTGGKKGKRVVSEDEEESMEESEASQDEAPVIFDCIEVE